MNLDEKFQGTSQLIELFKSKIYSSLSRSNSVSSSMDSDEDPDSDDSDDLFLNAR